MQFFSFKHCYEWLDIWSGVLIPLRERDGKDFGGLWKNTKIRPARYARAKLSIWA
jgi:hypothetical protein